MKNRFNTECVLTKKGIINLKWVKGKIMFDAVNRKNNFYILEHYAKVIKIIDEAIRRGVHPSLQDQVGSTIIQFLGGDPENLSCYKEILIEKMDW